MVAAANDPATDRNRKGLQVRHRRSRQSGGKMKRVLVFLVFSLILLASAFAQA